jgi:hypothetical protein
MRMQTRDIKEERRMTLYLCYGIRGNPQRASLKK